MGARGLEVNFLHLFDNGKPRTRRQVMLESFDVAWRTFRQNLNCSVCHVPDVTDNLVTSSSSLCEKTIADSLDVSADRKLSRNSRCVRLGSCHSRIPVFPTRNDARSKPLLLIYT
jgi:hypothetical protein